MNKLTKKQKKKIKKHMVKPLIKMDELSDKKEFSDVTLNDISDMRQSVTEVLDCMEWAIKKGIIEEAIDYVESKV